MCKLPSGLTFFYIYQCLSSGSATSHDLLFSWSWSSAKKDLLLLPPPACQWMVGMSSEWRWRAGVRLSARNQSQAGVLGLWPTNCTHPAIALLEKPSRADRSSRGLFSLCHRPRAVVRFNPEIAQLCRAAMTDGCWKLLKAVSTTKREVGVPVLVVLVSYGGAFQGFLIWVSCRLRTWTADGQSLIQPPSFYLINPILTIWLNFYFKHSIWMYICWPGWWDVEFNILNSILLLNDVVWTIHTRPSFGTLWTVSFICERINQPAMTTLKELGMQI